MNERTHSVLSATSRRALSLAFALSGLIAFSVSASDEKPTVDPRADELIKRMGEFLGQAKFFSVSAEVWQDAQLPSGQRVQAGRNIEVQVRRPDRYHSELRSTRHHRELFFDGSDLTLLNRADNFYGTIPAKGSLDDVMDIASEQFGITMSFEDFIRSDPHKDLLRKVTSGSDIAGR